VIGGTMQSFSGVHTILMVENCRSFYSVHFKIDGKQLVGHAHPGSSAFQAASILWKAGDKDDYFSVLRKKFTIFGKIDQSRVIRDFTIASDPDSPTYELDELLVRQIMES
jgi:hypothetical protein